MSFRGTLDAEFSLLMREACQYVEALDRLCSAGEITDFAQKTIGQFGFDYFCFYRIAAEMSEANTGVMARRMPDEWVKDYCDNQYADIDPVLRHCMRTIEPFEWCAAPRDPEREPRVAEYAAKVRDRGLWRSLNVPIPGTPGCEGNVWMGGREIDLTPRTQPLLHFISLYTFDRLRRVAGGTPVTTRHLSPREREVLAWVAAGKSSWEIGEILHITERTVEEHVQSSFRKLGAVNRTHAVALAVRDRIITV